ncbi:MAG: hypothetical protein ACKVQB_07445 [Bacteroidia bacterium]
MKVLGQIIYKTLLFTLPVWVFVFYLEYRLNFIENSYSFKIKNFYTIKDSCELLVLGNSQMLKGINPDLLPGVTYSMANVSQTYLVEEAFLKKYIGQMPRLKTVIIGMGYTSFGEVLENSEEEWRLAFYKKQYGLNFKNEWDIKNYSNIMLYTPYESLKIVLKNFKTDLVKGFQPNGWMEIDGMDASKLTDDWARKRANIHTKGLDRINISKNVKALKNMINLAKQKGIKIKIVCPMVQGNYLKYLDLKWLSINDSIMRSIENEFNLEILDYTKYPAQNLKNCFNDVDHLNKEGAKKLSLLIGKSLMKEVAGD